MKTKQQLEIIKDNVIKRIIELETKYAKEIIAPSQREMVVNITNIFEEEYNRDED